MFDLIALAALVPAVAQEAPSSPSVYDRLDLKALDGSPFDTRQLDGKVVLFVNVASKCGFTPQYEGLQALYDAKKDAGLVIVGVPCNQFAYQEPGSPEQIASFCRMNYGVTFPLLEKQKVNGSGRSKLYDFLVNSEVGNGAFIKWNFTKFLVDAKGEVVARFGSRTEPGDPALRQAIDDALASRPSVPADSP